MAQVSSRLLITLGGTNNIRSEDPSFVGLAMRPLSISLLCAGMAFNLEAGQFGQFLAHSAKTKNRHTCVEEKVFEISSLLDLSSTDLTSFSFPPEK